MVWYYGGGFQFGSANTPMYDGSSFAQNQDVIVVTPNYRTSGEYSSITWKNHLSASGIRRC